MKLTHNVCSGSSGIPLATPAVASCSVPQARMVVTYGPAKNLSVVVPMFMMEHYEDQYGSIDCRAEYSNFRKFEVDVKFDLAPPKPPGL